MDTNSLERIPLIGGSAPLFHICWPSIQVVPLGLTWLNPLILSWLSLADPVFCHGCRRWIRNNQAGRRQSILLKRTLHLPGLQQLLLVHRPGCRRYTRPNLAADNPMSFISSMYILDMKYDLSIIKMINKAWFYIKTI